MNVYRAWLAEGSLLVGYALGYENWFPLFHQNVFGAGALTLPFIAHCTVVEPWISSDAHGLTAWRCAASAHDPVPYPSVLVSEPTCATVPQYSWPMTVPGGAMPYRNACTSVPQIAQYFTFASTWLCPGSGMGTSPISNR